MTATSNDILLLPAAQGAAMIARRLLAAAAERRVALSNEGDGDALHDYRVALRRLRSWLRAFPLELGPIMPRKATRRLWATARASNASRDVEVQLGWLSEHGSPIPSDAGSALSHVVDQLSTRKEKADRRFRRRLEKDFDRTCAKLDAALARGVDRPSASTEQSTTTLTGAIASVVRTQVERLRVHLGEVRGHDDDASIHRARIAGKRLRYVLEPVSDSIPAASEALDRLKTFQDALGELHDAHVLVDAIAAVMDTVATERVERLVSAVRTVGIGSGELAESGNSEVELSLLALAERVHARVIRAFDDVRDSWLGADGEALLADVRALANYLDKLPTASGTLATEGTRVLRKVPA